MTEKKRIRVPVAAVDLTDIDDSSRFKRPAWCWFWIELTAILLLGVTLASSVSFWQAWFAYTDNCILSASILLGTVVYFYRASWYGQESSLRPVFGISIWTVAIFVQMAGWIAADSMPVGTSSIVVGLILAGWAVLRCHGESLGFGPGLAIIWSFPAAVIYAQDIGQLEQLQNAALEITAGLADASGLFYIRDSGSILYGLGEANRFQSYGVFDSAISFLGIAGFLILARRRFLFASIGTVVVAILVWVAIRSLTWTILVHTSDYFGTWQDWTFQIGLISLIVGAFFVLNLDQLVSIALAPVPFEFVNPEFPLFAILWNWLCGLPKLFLSVPEREKDFGSFEEVASR